MMVETKTAEDETHSTVVALVQREVKDVCWDVAFHERGLRRANAHMAAVRSMIERGQYSKAEIDIGELSKAVSENDDEDEDPPETTSGVVFARHVARSQLHELHYHEISLGEAYQKMASVREMLRRANYPEINLDELMADAMRRANGMG